jgi:Ser-tRNA(Ala) deacylase AlaX
MTDLLYLPDDDGVTTFEATVTEVGEDCVILDGTRFYPGGGQPADRGVLEHVDPLRVVEIEEFDVCPCGRTHVDRLGEIGEIRITGATDRNGDVQRIALEVR